MTRAYIGMGANLGDRVVALVAALDELDRVAGVRVVAVSSIYESEPWGMADQPAYANAVAEIETGLDADGLLAACKRIESEAGRVPSDRNAPRPLDLDILLFGDETRSTPQLTIPHPRMTERDFVVTPLLEVAPGVTLPDGSPILRASATLGRVTGVLAPPTRR
jgi:2-amino-4-hydroxy-6-hydroxymethyldihydropteridine diphosphokinase